MKILGTKFFGQEAAVFYIDTESHEIFAINADRISRLKKDNFDISPILDKYADKFKSLDTVSYSFAVFDGKDAVLETKGTSYYWLNYQRLYRKITKPRYYTDLHKTRSGREKILLFLQSLLKAKLFYYKLARDFYWKKYRNNSLPEGFHKHKIHKYIKETLKRYHISTNKINYYDHHLCHAVSAYYFSPFAFTEESIVFTLDEHGDESFSKLYKFDGLKYEELASSKATKFFIKNQVFITSIAGLYSNFTEAMDLRRSCDEGKVEALAAYGAVDSELYDKLMDIVKIEGIEYIIDENKYKVFSDYRYLKQLRHQISDQNFCATIQKWLEDIVIIYLNKVFELYKIENLCLAGGCIANVIMNNKIHLRTPFKKMYVFPPMGDEGSAAGAALLAALEDGVDISWLKEIRMPYFGPESSKEEVLNSLNQFNQQLSYEYLADNWYRQAAKTVSQNKIIAVFQGRMEFGPRALGNRSIIANPRDKTIRDKINAQVKKRPWYQPLCPSVLEEEREKLFENSYSHKHMATAFAMKKEYWDELPSAIHIDGTARPQFIEKNDNPNFYNLINEVKKYTGYGVVLNTSFNMHGRTIVNTPKDAIVDFLDCNIDELYIEGYRVVKKNDSQAE